MLTSAQIILVVLGFFATVMGGLLLWGLKTLISTVFSTALEIRTLNGHIATLNKSHEEINQLKKDVNAIGKKLRGEKDNGQD